MIDAYYLTHMYTYTALFYEEACVQRCSQLCEEQPLLQKLVRLFKT